MTAAVGEATRARWVDSSAESSAKDASRCRRHGANHQVSATRYAVQALSHQGTQPTADPVADHRATDGRADDEAHADRAVTRLRGGWRRGRRAAAPGTTASSTAHGGTEVVGRRSRWRAGSTGCLRRTARRGPYACGRRGSRSRPGCACADGSRGSWRGGGCSAGRCACSRGVSIGRQTLWSAAGGPQPEVTGPTRCRPQSEAHGAVSATVRGTEASHEHAKAPARRAAIRVRPVHREGQTTPRASRAIWATR